MNKNQKTILACTAIAIFLMLLFPPFYARLPQGMVRNLGYHFIFWGEPLAKYGTVNISLLMGQWFAALLIGGLLWFMIKDSDHSK